MTKYFCFDPFALTGKRLKQFEDFRPEMKALIFENARRAKCEMGDLLSGQEKKAASSSEMKMLQRVALLDKPPARDLLWEMHVQGRWKKLDEDLDANFSWLEAQSRRDLETFREVLAEPMVFFWQSQLLAADAAKDMEKQAKLARFLNIAPIEYTAFMRFMLMASVTGRLQRLEAITKKYVRIPKIWNPEILSHTSDAWLSLVLELQKHGSDPSHQYISKVGAALLRSDLVNSEETEKWLATMEHVAVSPAAHQALEALNKKLRQSKNSDQQFKKIRRWLLLGIPVAALIFLVFQYIQDWNRSRNATPVSYSDFQLDTTSHKEPELPDRYKLPEKDFQDAARFPFFSEMQHAIATMEEPQKFKAAKVPFSGREVYPAFTEKQGKITPGYDCRYSNSGDKDVVLFFTNSDDQITKSVYLRAHDSYESKLDFPLLLFNVYLFRGKKWCDGVMEMKGNDGKMQLMPAFVSEVEEIGNLDAEGNVAISLQNCLMHVTDTKVSIHFDGKQLSASTWDENYREAGNWESELSR